MDKTSQILALKRASSRDTPEDASVGLREAYRDVPEGPLPEKLAQLLDQIKQADAK